MARVVLGIDIGTSSSKGVLVDLGGNVVATATREHEVSRPHPGWVEMTGEVWWGEFCSLARELLQTSDADVLAVGVSGMGPCVLVTDGAGVPLRPAILYGVDTRATEQVARLTAELGSPEILERCGSELSTQAVGPKIEWIADFEPEVAAAARLLFMPASWLAWNLTGSYVLDHHSASQCTPLYDTIGGEWYPPWVERIAPGYELPPLVWPGDVVGAVTGSASVATGIPAGVPVIAGTIDAWAEAVSVGAQGPGDLMLMYGTTMFLINTISDRIAVPGLWGTVGAFPGTRNLAGGMATSGAITAWLRGLFGSPSFPELLAEASAAGPGAHGLLMLPYFAGERTPIADPDARGVIAGLTVEHTRGDLYRAALEATAMGVRHNVDALRAAGGLVERVVAVGGGTQGGLWTQVVSDVTGLEQLIPRVTIGASYGAAFLAASVLQAIDIAEWNPIVARVVPRDDVDYHSLYSLYLALYRATAPVVHALAARQQSPHDSVPGDRIDPDLGLS